jgi:hypothetical protein
MLEGLESLFGIGRGITTGPPSAAQETKMDANLQANISREAKIVAELEVKKRVLEATWKKSIAMGKEEAAFAIDRQLLECVSEIKIHSGSLQKLRACSNGLATMKSNITVIGSISEANALMKMYGNQMDPEVAKQILDKTGDRISLGNEVGGLLANDLLITNEIEVLNVDSRSQMEDMRKRYDAAMQEEEAEQEYQHQQNLKQQRARLGLEGTAGGVRKMRPSDKDKDVSTEEVDDDFAMFGLQFPAISSLPPPSRRIPPKSAGSSALDDDLLSMLSGYR